LIPRDIASGYNIGGKSFIIKMPPHQKPTGGMFGNLWIYIYFMS
jgi:hypothetical protein